MKYHDQQESTVPGRLWRTCNWRSKKMTFTSYAQNIEDVMLWRALKHIENGFYIDVGAWSPDLDSVTRAFYERGWRGINVEPNSQFHAQLLARRTRDINLRIAVSDKEGTLIMNFLSNPGLSTLDEAIAQRHALTGLTIDKQEVLVTNLATLWKQHVPEGQDVHFLKVDVEGLEEAALRGNDWSKYRPWILVVEATLPMSQQESHDTWEPILLTADYHFVYADGLNRFYVANEHAELFPAFKYPPNVFDDFLLNDAKNGAEKLTQELAIVRDRAMQIEVQLIERSKALDSMTQALTLEREGAKWLENEWNTTKRRVEEQIGELAVVRDRAMQIEVQLTERSKALDSVTKSLNQERERSLRLENEWNAATVKIDELKGNSHYWWTMADNLIHEHQAMQASFCWRITSPLRVAFDALLWMRAILARIPLTIISSIRIILSSILAGLIRFAIAHPMLKARALTLLHRSPAIEAWFRSFTVAKGLLPGGTTVPFYSEDNFERSKESLSLTPNARYVYFELKAAIERNKKGPS
jgi:FkbM family methyltransferase